MKKTQYIFAMFFAAWIFSSSLLAATTSWSPGTFVNIGVVGKLSKSTIFIDDVRYVLSPTAKFSTVDKSDASIEGLKLRQMVGFSIYTNNNRRIVDHLWLIPENERPLYRLEP
jgi:hypothetical protein